MNNQDREKILEKHGVKVLVNSMNSGGYRASIWYDGHYVVDIRTRTNRHHAIRLVFESYKNALWMLCAINEQQR